MKVDFKQIIHGENGEPAKISKAIILENGERAVLETDEAMTLGWLCRRALTNNMNGDGSLSQDEKDKYFELWTKIGAEPEGDFEVNDVALLRDRVGIAIQSIVLRGHARKMLTTGEVKATEVKQPTPRVGKPNGAHRGAQA